jgi:hypothetical protein
LLGKDTCCRPVCQGLKCLLIVIRYYLYSFIGPAEVAAWGLIGYIWSAFEELTGKTPTSDHELLDEISSC